MDLLSYASSQQHESVIVLLDFAKAFDKVCHSYLPTKMSAFGFTQDLISWIIAFLSNRRQKVTLGNASSDWCNVQSGVPQGSVIGPLLFIIFINDLPDLIHHKCKLFADDTKIIASLKSDQDRINLQADINSCVAWAALWKMSFNASKCKVMTFKKRSNNILNTAFIFDSDSNYTMCNDYGDVQILEETSVERDLGILLDNRLNWSHQIDSSISKAYKTLGMLRRSFKYWTPDTFRTLFTTFVRPHLEYCAPIWNPSDKASITALEKVQRKASKAVPSLRSYSYSERLKKFSLTTLENRRNRGDFIQFYKLQKGLNIVNWTEPIAPRQSTLQTGPAQGIRGPYHSIAKPALSSSKTREHLLPIRIATTWNSLPSAAIDAPTTNCFKNIFDKLKLTTF